MSVRTDGEEWQGLGKGAISSGRLLLILILWTRFRLTGKRFRLQQEIMAFRLLYSAFGLFEGPKQKYLKMFI